MALRYENSSFGWDPDSKRKELFDKLSRFILVYKEGSTELLAFVMFRFEFEVDEDVIYWQVASSAQGVSLGRRLIGELETLCRMYKMKKIMLTVLKANSRALEFYKAVGFTMDPTSPGYVDSDAEEESESGSEQEIVDYEILSKLILP
uniref:N-alpha-acetyltransferase 40 n=1 Tax=Psilocybe cubensis TaxID=181762 RepID=A0A8H8CQQ5_PSICU